MLGYRVALCLVALLLVAACSAPTAAPTATPGPFRSDENHLTVSVPAGWAAVEGPIMLARPYTGLVAFNSWGQPGFWIPEVRQGSALTYAPDVILGQVPARGAYVVFIHFAGGPMMAPAYYGPEYESSGLADLSPPEDCRQDGAWWSDFAKWGRRLRLEVYCRPDASDETAAAVNELMAGWTFDTVPAGDPGWACVQARQLLPAQVGPEQFPIVANRPTGPEPVQSYMGTGTEARITEVRMQGDTVWVMYIYRWNDPPNSGSSSDCPADRCHWWRYAAHADGQVVPGDEGGAPLPP